ncbi:hypothetical protein LCGC14_2032210, partial [marine sediment metagenome]
MQGSEATQELFGIILAVGAEARSGGLERRGRLDASQSLYGTLTGLTKEVEQKRVNA